MDSQRKGTSPLFYTPFDPSSFKVGETVNVAGVQGKVEEMTLSSCLIITEERHHVTVPNAKIWGNAIRNLSRGASEHH